ncbi:TetR/AcrR family transcriptional regulator C-terminal domain-containing protein [Veillonella agrestimuris]|uniref:TetR/AcrR family transcriptional regulator C-terminal domain-containing protein n=1 Tax=Veillonella agrestimuris TaxID=2941340 RepID=UPI00203D6594|nr:TetR/AcrR family transcriptional regulator C-terminal domain-containing protein [Veillonella agrestimuris]
MERKKDLRVLKTKTIIQNTFKEMILEMNASSIKVKALTERAMINRKTFYLHYNCLENLYEEILSDLFKDYSNAINTLPDNPPFTEVNRVFFEFMAKQKPYMEKIVCDPSYREFSDNFFTSMLLHNRKRYNPYKSFTKEEQNIINTFLSIGSVNLYRKWIEDKKRIPLEDLINLSGKLFHSGISSIL